MTILLFIYLIFYLDSAPVQDYNLNEGSKAAMRIF